MVVNIYRKFILRMFEVASNLEELVLLAVGRAHRVQHPVLVDDPVLGGLPGEAGLPDPAFGSASRGLSGRRGEYLTVERTSASALAVSPLVHQSLELAHMPPPQFHSPYSASSPRP